MKATLLCITAVAMGFVCQDAAFAQIVAAPTEVRYGPQLNFASQTDLGIGARVELAFPQLYPGLFGIASVDAFFPNCSDGNCGFLEVNAGAAVPFDLEELLVLPYAGGGLSFSRAGAGVTDGAGLGLNLLGGVKIPVEELQFTPFTELRLEFGGGGQFVVTGGILF